MATAPPKVIHDRVEGTHVYVGTNVWFFHWLADPDLKSFRYECSKGSFTARQRKGGYWNAYRKINGKLRQEYLGKAEDLSLSKLIETAFLLALPGTDYWRKKYPRPGEQLGRLDKAVIQAKDNPSSPDQIQESDLALYNRTNCITSECTPGEGDNSNVIGQSSQGLNQQIAQLTQRIAQLEKELAEVTEERDNYRDTLDEFIKDGERWHQERNQLEAKAFDEEKAARILAALGVGRQALQYKRVQAVIKELTR